LATRHHASLAIHRLRLRQRALIRDEVAHTVSTGGEIDDEIRHLIAQLFVVFSSVASRAS
jgi:hypothetical protein